MATKFRPSHADYTYQAKFGIRTWQGGGRSSARETIGRVAAGAIARKILRQRYGVEVLAYVRQVQRITADVDPDKVKAKDIESNIVRCPDSRAAQRMIRLDRERCAKRATPSAASWRAWRAACRPAGANRCSTASKRTWPKPC